MATTWTETATAGGDVLVRPGRKNLTLEALIKEARPPLARMIAAMCDWGPDGAGGRVGDVRFMIVEFAVSAGLGFYVQILNEPGDPVLSEAVSGALHKPVKTFMTPARRKALGSLGYRVGGSARNFQKEWQVKDRAAAAGLADELLRILFDVYGYRGRQPLRVGRHSDARTQPSGVFSALTIDDVRKLASGVGITALPLDPTRLPSSERRHAAAHLLRVVEPFTFFMEMCAPDRRCKGWFHGVGFRAGLAETSHVPDARLLEIAGEVPFVRIHRDADGDVLAFWDLALNGASPEYFQEALKRWLWLWMKVTTLVESSPPARRQGERTQARTAAEDEADLPREPRAKPAKMLVH